MTTADPGRDPDESTGEDTDDRPGTPGRRDVGEFDDKDVSGDDPSASSGSGYTSKDPG